MLRTLRRRAFQGLWERLRHYSTIGMNHWAATVEDSGERLALAYAVGRLAGAGPFCVVDVGANIGQFAFAAAITLDAGARIHSLEPSARAFQILEANIAARGLTDRIEAVRLGLGMEAGPARLYSSSPGASIASLHDLYNPLRPFSPAFSEMIELTTLDRFCAERNIDRIDYLKLDIEGHELFALQGAARMLTEQRIRFIQFEFGEANIDSRTYLRDFHRLLGPNSVWHRIVSDGLRLVPAYSAELEVFATINYLVELAP